MIDGTAFRQLSFLVLFITSIAAAQTSSKESGGLVANVDLPRYPALSPDAKTISFTWHGDLFTVPIIGGLANRLTSSPFDDTYSAFSPDGKRIAFTSSRYGAGNLFTMAIDGTDLKQVTYTDRGFFLTQWAKDDHGHEKLFTTAVLDVQPFPGAQLWEVSPAGGDPDRITLAEGSYPCSSPDGKRLLITRGVSPWSRRGYTGSQNRDVWIYDRPWKSFTQVTKYNGNDGKAKWADDNTILFISDRTDRADDTSHTLNLFSMKPGAADESAIQLTHLYGKGIDDFDVAPGSGTVVYTSWDKLYSLKLASSAQPAPIAVRANEEEADRVRFQSVSASVSETALSPDAKTMAIVSYGEIYVRAIEAKSATRHVTPNLGGRKRDIAWSADGTRLLFVCDVAGQEEIYEATVKLTRSELRKKAAEATSKPSTTVEEEPEASGAPVSATTQPATQPATIPPKTPEDSADANLSVDQFVSRRSGATTGPTTSPASEGARWGDALAFTINRLFTAVRGDTKPTPSPDDHTLAYQHAEKDSGYALALRDEATGKETVLVKNSDGFDFRWSPDSRYIAYATEDRNNNSDIFLVPADGSEKAVNLTRHPNADGSPRFSADGKILAFLSNRTGTGDEMAAYEIYLDKSLEEMADPELEQYFKEAAAAAKKRSPATTRPSKVKSTTAPSSRPTSNAATTRSGPTTKPLPLKRADLEDAYLRIRRITNVRGSVSDMEISPAGDRIYFNGYIGPTRSLLSQARDATDPTRLGVASSITGISLAGDVMATVNYVAGGHAAIIKLPSGEAENYDPTDRLQIDLAKQSEQKFLEAARIMGNQFYNPQMNGVDWKANTAAYLQLARAAHTADEFDFVANRFIGELNASHLGINAPDAASPLAQRVGRLGVAIERCKATSETVPTTSPATAPAEGFSHFEVTSVTVDGPADHGAMALKVGDRIIAIDFAPLPDNQTFDQILLGKAGTEVVVSIVRDGKPLDLLITPTTAEALGALAYNQWRLETAKKVDELSHGRIGYIHIQGMNQASLETYKRDLFAACDGKDGLIIDVRWNGGGSTADLLLASIMSAYHAFTVPRGAEIHKDSYPTDRLFIPRFVGAIDMLCNEKSFSNAEITAHAFKTLKRGTLIGNTTAGGVISTGGATLLDGTTVRTPGRGWFTPDGVNMELHGAQPDVMIPQTPEDEVAQSDRQLKAAVDDLMKRLE